MNIFRPVFLASLLALLQACATQPGTRADIDAVLRASGLDAQLELLKQPLKNEKMDGLLAMIPDEWITMVNATIADTLKPEEIREALKQDLQKNLSDHELRDVQKFYESETGRNIVALESGKLGSTPTHGTDRAAPDALANATGAGKAVSILAEHGLNDAVDIALKNGCFGLDKVPFASMLAGVVKKSQLSALRQSVTASVRQQYTRLVPADQSAYLAFAESGAGQKFFAARTRVMTSAAQQTGDALNGQLGQRISQVCTAAKA